MDILDEIDAVIQEKKSKWKYTPMREKKETDAIIDELLREFPSDGYEEDAEEYQVPPADIQSVDDYEQTAEPEEEQGPEEQEIAPYVYNEEQQERLQYEQSLKNSAEDIKEEQAEPVNYDTASENDSNVSEDNIEPEVSVEAETYGEPEIDDDEPEDDAEPETDDVSEPEKEPENIKDGNNEYNEYISHKYTAAKYEEEEEAPLYNDDEYDGEDDDDFEEFEEEMPEDSGRKKYTDKDFNNFMDSANDGEKGDIPKFSFSSAIVTILKILVLAAFGALAVVGIINTVSIGVDKYNKSKVKPDNILKEELQSVIYPVVVTETTDFKTASELTSEQLVNIAVWEVVINGNKSVFKDKDTDEFLLPQEQMVYIIEKLFGEDTGFKHTDSGIGDKKVVYDAKNKQYILPEDTDLYTLRPVVTDVAQTGDVFAVYADCYRSNPSWSNIKSDEPVKRVVVTMKKTSEYYNITDMKTIPLN